MEIYSNYIDTARRMKSDISRGEFFNAIVWFIEDGTEPMFDSEAAACSFQAIMPSLVKQRQRKLAGESSAKKRTKQKGNEPTNESGNEHANEHGNEQTNEVLNETTTNSETNGEQANKLLSYQAIKLSSIDNNIVPYHEVIDYLNEKTGKNFKANSKAHQQLIRARFSEGYTLNDFKTVIDNMASHWSENKDMEKYLRPQTLFGSKFDSYLNTKPKGDSHADFGEYANVL